MHQYILKWVDLFYECRELDSRGYIKNIKAAWTEADIKKFNLNWIPIVLKTGEVRFIKATIV